MKMPQHARRAFLAALSVAMFALINGLHPSGAASQSPQLTVANAWARAVPPRAPTHAPTAAVYVRLTGATGDGLTSGSAPVDQQAELHQTTNQGGFMCVRPLTRDRCSA